MNSPETLMTTRPETGSEVEAGGNPRHMELVRLLTAGFPVPRAAKLAGLDRAWVYRLIKQGRLPDPRRGQRYYTWRMVDPRKKRLRTAAWWREHGPVYRRARRRAGLRALAARLVAADRPAVLPPVRDYRFIGPVQVLPPQRVRRRHGVRPRLFQRRYYGAGTRRHNPRPLEPVRLNVTCYFIRVCAAQRRSARPTT